MNTSQDVVLHLRTVTTCTMDAAYSDLSQILATSDLDTTFPFADLPAPRVSGMRFEVDNVLGLVFVIHGSGLRRFLSNRADFQGTPIE